MSGFEEARRKLIAERRSLDKFYERAKRKQSALNMKLSRILCWLLGHKVVGQSVPGAYTSVSGEVVDGYRYYCIRCNANKKECSDIGPDRRNLYKRSFIPLWFNRRKNERKWRELNRRYKSKP